MSESDRDETSIGQLQGTTRRPYQRPEIVWREPYDPISFGISCAKQPGNPGCLGLVSA